jgi:ethanolamine utilization protein EutP (predicted NTPase)
MISFNAIIADKRSLYVEQSEWYYALCLLKKDNIVAARSALQKISMDNGFYKTSAEEILNKLGN